MQESQKFFFREINLFRAIAIVFVVFAHCSNLSIFSFKKNTLSYNIIVYIFSGSTTFFVFISGFIFYFKHSSGFIFFEFYLKKLKFILLPYLFFIHIDILYYITCLFASHLFKFPYDSTLLTNYNYLSALVYGNCFIPIGLWFIPVILLVYLISSLLISLSRVSNYYILFILFILFIFSMFIHRNFEYNFIGTFFNLIYFIPFFILGMFFSKNYTSFKLINPLIYILLFLLIIISFYFQTKVGQKAIFNVKLQLANLDFMVIQKLALTIIIFPFLSKIKNYSLTFINNLGKLSFGVFFVHGIVIFIVNQILRHYNFIFKTNTFLIYIVISIFILFISFLFVIFIKKIIGENSRFLIGC